MADAGREDADTAGREDGLVAHYAARGIALTPHQARELASVIDRLDRMKAIVRAAASKAAGAAKARPTPRRP